MKKSKKPIVGTLSGGLAMLVAGAAFAASSNSGTDTKNTGRTNPVVIRVASDLCEFDRELPRKLVVKLRRLSNYDELLAYMLSNCPELALSLADTPTASISRTIFGGGEDGTSGGPGGTSGGSGGTSGGSGGVGGSGGSGGGSGGHDSGSGKKDTEDDGNNGHGNDPDKRDSSNPGKKH